ncbi:uncharacterized protein [Rhodnius prolixus]|uniref:uncharacterized protein n=1 Tax=Rhodnius prolixus TaxID=13249 RepID=UPI003D18CC3F
MTEPLKLSLDQKIILHKDKAFSLADDIKSICETGRRISTDSTAISLFKGMFRSLDVTYEKFMNEWAEIKSLYLAKDAESEFPSKRESTILRATKDFYYEAGAIFEIHCASYQPRPTTSIQNSLLDLSQCISIRSRLPHITIPVFSGKLQDWPLFRDTFSSMVHDETSLTAVEKYHFLLANLQGSALSVIKHVPVSEVGYEQAWSALLQHYDNKRKLAAFYLDQILNFKPLTGKATAASLQHFMQVVIENVTSFEKIKIPNSSKYIMFELALRCLDESTRESFELAAADEFPTCDDLAKFVRKKVNAKDITERGKRDLTPILNQPFKPNNTRSNRTHIKPSNSFFTNTTSSPSVVNEANQLVSSSRSPTCFLCKQRHKLTECPTYVRGTPKQRYDILKNWAGCKNCLYPGHRTRECTSRWKCRQCGGRHHTTLHLQPSIPSMPSITQPTPQLPSTNKEEPSATNVAFSAISANHTPEVLLGTAIVQICDVNGVFHPIRVVIDCGSQYSFITESCASMLQLPSIPFNISVSGIGQSMLLTPTKKVMCTLRSLCSVSPDLYTEAVVIPIITQQLPHQRLPPSVWKRYIHLNLADPDFWNPGPIDFLLGADLFLQILDCSSPPCEFNFNQKEPKLLSTIFGQIIMGKCTELSCSQSTSSFFITSSDVYSLMERFWEIETIKTEQPTLSPDDQFCEDHFKATHSRMPDGRYVVSLPFLTVPNYLGPTNLCALHRLRNVEFKLARDSALSHQYHSFLQEYLDLGHMVTTNRPAKCVIPHHGVSKIVNGESKLRVVFDGSCRTTFGSLNDYLGAGPKLQTDISDIILNFRKHRFVITADIVKMYRQILISVDDRVYQHILWRFSSDHPIEEFELTTVTYGLKSSPFLALRVIQQLVTDEGTPFPLATKALTHDTYVDDIVTGASTIDEILSIKEQLIALLSKGGFQLSKWTSNSSDVIKPSPDQCKVMPISFSEMEEPTVKLLGLQWDPIQDVFSYKIHMSALPSTKRMILSTIARIYDPLGYVSPSVFIAKILLQETWKLGIGWDENLPTAILHTWENFLQDIPNLQQVRIPRYLMLDDTQAPCSIVGFCDASERGYGAVLYIVSIVNSKRKVFLLKSKSKLAPLKPMTIPRLELCGALLLASLYTSIAKFIKHLRIESTWFFTDSATVLSWFQIPAHTLKTFVAHRVVRISELTNIKCWKHISSHENPADCCSRGLLPTQLLNHPLWWAGPPWLIQPEILWPSNETSISSENIPEIKSSHVTLTVTFHASDFINWTERFSKYRRLVNSLAYALRFVPKSKFSDHIRPKGPITALEFDAANIKCIKLLQHHYYPEAFNDHLNPTPLMLSLNVFVDQTGILRVGGRLRHSSLPIESKHPILLPRRSQFTNILIDYFHIEHAHAGPATLLAAIQQQYWIPAGRSLVKQRKRTCIICHKMTKSNRAPLMGDLPPERLSSVRAFYQTGVDFAGPFLCKETPRRKSPLVKVYLCLFVCLSTKAVHLELVHSLSTEAFIDALDRFIARRGKPVKMLSDCGKNFVGAANYLAEVAAWHDSETTQACILDHINHHHITWLFNPPQAPHFGGIWEAGVKSTKTLLRKLIGSSTFSSQELNNIFIKIEAILNSRPLQPLSTDPQDLQPLTPGHFLIGAPLTALPEATLTDVPLNHLTRWQYLRERVQHFWSRWQKEYLQTLQQRTKWITTTTNLKVGDMVLLKDLHTWPLQWPLARVISIHPGPDGIVRVATVKTAQGVYKRPVTKLAPLPQLNENMP